MTKLTVKELREHAKVAGIKGYSRMREAELEAALSETISAKTVEDFRKAYEAKNQGWSFVKIYEMREMLGWSRSEFDEMLRKLRDEGIVQIYLADETTMTPDEVRDCFIDENGFRMGTMTWEEETQKEVEEFSSEAVEEEEVSAEVDVKTAFDRKKTRMEMQEYLQGLTVKTQKELYKEEFIFTYGEWYRKKKGEQIEEIIDDYFESVDEGKANEEMLSA